ncbi:MAG: 2-dehydropantoate 2-reductase [Ardenticatenaceae bacterium]|nr:2-dehydropantoate 2-reductase [Ardenticatenaceae bacterium]
MRVVVIGAGAMGSLFGGRLAAGGKHEVWLLDPWVEHVAALRTNGLTLVNPDGMVEQIAVNVTTEASAVPTPADLALIFVKSHATRRAAEQASPLLGENGLALTLQNGLGNHETIASVVGAGRVIQGVTSHGATLLGPGHVRHAGVGPTHLAAAPEQRPAVAVIAAAFSAAGLATDIQTDLETLIWGKLIVNVGINALTALLRVQNGVLAEVPEARLLLVQAITEAVAVARAAGIALPYDDAVSHVLAVARATGANRSSMLADVLRGAPTEVEVINGSIVRVAERLGMDAPVNRMLTALVRALDTTAGRRV